MAELIQKQKSLKDAVLEWWEEHRYDVDSGDPDDDGYRQEWNRYDEPPEFVEIAQIEKEGGSFTDDEVKDLVRHLISVVSSFHNGTQDDHNDAVATAHQFLEDKKYFQFNQADLV